MKISAEDIKTLRERTGVSMSKCKEALEQSGGEMEAAIDFLRKSGMASAVKKESREANEGIVAFAEGEDYVAVLEVNSETDFVAQNENFRSFVKKLCETGAKNKTASVEELLNLPYPEDPSLTVDQYRAVMMQSLGENIRLKRMLLLPKGENLSVGLYSHMGGKIVSGVILTGAGGCESLAREVAMHVAAEAPDYLIPEEVPADVRAREEEVARARIQGKPENMVAKIVEGKMNAFYDQVCLVRQPFIKDNALTVGEVVDREGKKLGKTLAVTGFIRWKVGG